VDTSNFSTPDCPTDLVEDNHHVKELLMKAIPVFIIDMAQGETNYCALKSQLDSTGFDIHRVTGVAGHMIPDSIYRRLTGDRDAVGNKGMMGRVLSHLLAWEHIRHLGVSFALVLENDVVAIGPEHLNSLSVPAKFDLVFFDTRVANASQCRSVEFPNGVKPSISRLGMEVVGANAYLISPSGAVNLIEYFQQDSYSGDVDLRLFAYCTGASLLYNGRGGSVSDEVVAACGLIGHRKPLLGYVCTDSLFSRPASASGKLRHDGPLRGSIVPHGSSLLSRVF
jgi:hypothetical protein